MKKLSQLYLVMATIIVALLALSSDASNDLCPVWTIPSNDNQCKCGSDVYHTVLCDLAIHDSGYLLVLRWYCITFSDVLNKTVVGHCLYNINWILPWPNIYFNRIPGRLENENANNSILCQFINHSVNSRNYTVYQYQTGLMCTSCMDGYAFPVYSYSMACVECTDYRYNWLKYIAVAFLPLTIFYMLVILFRIHVTSGAINGYVLICQVLAVPLNIRLAMQVDVGDSYPTTLIGRAKILHFSFLAIWNLDFFRGFYSPFCLHPKLTTLQTLMLDYVIAVYPLFLIIFTYICVKLHSRYSLVVKLWSPFYKCFALFRNQWDIKRSLIDAFATFILLSYVKILNVSFYALIPNTLYDIKGNEVSKRFLYYDGTYEYFGPDHIPYALLAVFMLFVFNILPLLLICVYPCHCFHRIANCIGLKFLLLHNFMDTFNGCFKFQPRDYRYFAAVYLILRLFNHAFSALTVDPSYIPLAAFMFTTMAVVVAMVRPHRSLLHTVADAIFFFSVSVLFITLCGYRLVFEFQSRYADPFLYGFGIPVALIQFLYGIGLIVYSVLPQKVMIKVEALFNHCKLIITKQSAAAETEYPRPYRLDHSDEYPPLLPVN